MILEAVAHDKDCVLANILAAEFLLFSDSSRASSYLDAAESHLVITHLIISIFFFFFFFWLKDFILFFSLHN